MLRLIFITTAALSLAAFATVSQADVAIYVEDFEDEQGEPAFDPMFNHSISLLNDQGYYRFYDGAMQFGRPGDWFLDLYYAHDAVTFNLLPNQVVIAASIEIVAAWNLSFGFVGESGEKRHDGYYHGIYDVSSEEIGNISTIWFQYQGTFNDITIVIVEVPEPNVSYGLIVIGLLYGFALIRKYRNECMQCFKN